MLNVHPLQHAQLHTLRWLLAAPTMAFVPSSPSLVPHVILQIAPVVDASSAQSRVDVLGIVMSAVLLLTGLQWLSLKPRVMPAVRSHGWVIC